MSLPLLDPVAVCGREVNSDFVVVGSVINAFVFVLILASLFVRGAPFRCYSRLTHVYSCHTLLTLMGIVLDFEQHEHIQSDLKFDIQSTLR